MANEGVMKKHLEGVDAEIASERIEELQADLEMAREHIAKLESRLSDEKETCSRLLADDLRACEELSELKRLIWGYHLGLPGGCGCDICVEAEQSQWEIEDLI